MQSQATIPPTHNPPPHLLPETCASDLIKNPGYGPGIILINSYLDLKNLLTIYINSETCYAHAQLTVVVLSITSSTATLF